MNQPFRKSSRARSRRSAAVTSSMLWMPLSVLLLAGCGQKAAPSAEPTATPTPVPTATVAATPTAAPTVAVKVPTYTGAQQMEYLETAKDAFLTLRQAQSQPYIEAHNAFEAAGGVNAKGLTSKDAITARRDLLAKCVSSNDAYLEFVKTQEDTYRAELSKTPLLPADVDSVVREFSLHNARTAAIVQLRESEREALKCGDDMLAALEKSYGDWTVDGSGRLTFKKKPLAAMFSASAQKYNKVATEEEKMRLALNNANLAPSASVVPSASPAPSASSSPTATPAP